MKYHGIRTLAALLLAMLLPVFSQAEAIPAGLASPILEAKLEDVTQTAEGGRVSYPMLTGLSNEAVEEQVNQAILAKADIAAHLNTLTALHGEVNVSYQAFCQAGILSIVFDASGRIGPEEVGQKTTAMTFDLSDGREITAQDLFSSVDSAKEIMETILEERVLPEISGYMENSELIPVPMDNFYLDDAGLTFYYPREKFSFVSGYAGGASFFYYELAQSLKLEDGGVLDRIGAMAPLTGEEQKAAIQKAVEQGRLPGIGVALGDELEEAIEAYRLLCEPDFYPGGRFFLMEAPQMRDIWLMTGHESEEYTGRVLGVRADRMDLYGLKAGITTREEWQAVLGEPDSTAELDDYTAEDYYLTGGVSDYYTYGSRQLRLHGDESGVLQSIQVLD